MVSRERVEVFVDAVLCMLCFMGSFGGKRVRQPMRLVPGEGYGQWLIDEGVEHPGLGSVCVIKVLERRILKTIILGPIFGVRI